VISQPIRGWGSFQVRSAAGTVRGGVLAGVTADCCGASAAAASVAVTLPIVREPAARDANVHRSLTFAVAAAGRAAVARSGALPTLDGMVGRVILAATPLGRPSDASEGLRRALADSPVIAAEDTRRLRRLCADLGVTPSGRVVSFFDGNETERVPQLLASLRDGADVLVVSDAGMPSVSDPGFRLVAAAVAHGVTVTTLPGPSAVLAALAVSGLPVDRFCFEGFLPRKAGDRRRAVEALRDERRTLVLFEAPHRLADTLAALADVFGGDRRAAVCRELTKTYEQVRRGTLAELAEWARGDVRGEITLVVEGAAPAAPEAGDLAVLVAARERAGIARKQAISEVARAANVPKRDVYDAVVAAKSAMPLPVPTDG
jgi:16S rRNA (cytidine1402-2'-O)-methyltransferase